MISEFFIDIFFNIADGFFSLMPDITWSVDTTAWQYGQDFIDMIAYLLPMDTITAVVVLIFDITLFRIGVSLIRNLIGLIPGF